MRKTGCDSTRSPRHAASAIAKTASPGKWGPSIRHFFRFASALRAGTLAGAKQLGMDSEIGSLEKGKLADLVVLEKNPLENIRATIDTRYVMVDGRLFDVAADMAEIGNDATPEPNFYWQRHRDGQTFGTEFGPTAVCHCPKGHHGGYVHLD